MSALPPSQMRAMRAATQASSQPARALEAQWEALHTIAAGLAPLAQLGGRETKGETPEIAALLGSANPWQFELAEHGIEDIGAMMAVGLKALAILTERGLDTSAPALTLWREFYQAREAVLSLLEPHQKAA